MSIPTPDQRREATAVRLRAIIEWISNDLGDHARAVELDNAVHDLEVHAIRVGVPYRPPRDDDGDPVPPGQEDASDDLPDGFVFHGPSDLAARIVTALSQPRPQVRKARKLGRVLMDALAADSDATCRHQEAWLPAPSYLEQETGDAPSPGAIR